ncbi:HAD-IB family hydrolase [Helicobacter labetoulli]|uniref:HAD-IB family hydrolase n=1 Tax=Helicobacter labetoulli TaxID=2315333 RepID=UPI000EF66B1E|nr:HAD-IB family hydrolase [Helicobacter labetoulli]
MQTREQNNRVLALFDFCETLVDFQSAARYLEIVAKYRGYNIQQGLGYRVYVKIKRKIGKILPKSYRDRFVKKPVNFEVLQGLSLKEAEDIAQDFFEKELLVRVNERIIERLHYHQKLGHTIAIVSGGFEIYIRIFAKYFGIPYVVAVSLDSSEGVLSGNMAGIHTMEHRKLYKLSQTLDLSMYDLAQSYAYSDCPSDIPLLSLVGNGIVVECGKDIEWAKILGFEIV